MGGSSSSSASTTNNVDKRLVTGDGSVGISSDTSTVHVSVLDGGAVSGALNLAMQTDANAGKNLSTVLNFAGLALALSAESIGQSAATIKESSATVATAYDQAKGQGADARVLAYGAMAVVALVAVKSFGK